MNDAETILALEETWSKAPREGDLETVGSVVADDWLAVGPAGQTMTKKDLLEMLGSHPGLFETTEYSDVRLSLFGSTAVVTSAFHGVGQVELKQRYLRVYAKRGGRWRCVVTQIVPTPVDAVLDES